MSMESIYEYGSRAGFWRLWRMFTERNMPVTVYGVATALMRNPEAVAAMKEAGWEIASHGLKWIDYRDFSSDEERAHMSEAIRIHTEVTGDASARLVYGPHLRAHQSPRRGGGRLPLQRRFLCRRAALLGGARRKAAAHRALYARRQRHALRDAAGLQFRRPVLRLSEGHFRHALCRGRDRAEDAVGRAPLPPRRPSRARRGARALPGLRRFA